MNNPIDKAIKDMLNGALAELEKVLNSDVLCYFGPIANGNENMMLQIVKELAQDPNKKEQLDSYMNAMNAFNELIDKGFTKSRGYNLQTIEELGFTNAFNIGV